MTAYIRKGWGFNVDLDFARATEDTPIELDDAQFGDPNRVVWYIAGNPDHSLTFMRAPRIRVFVDKRAIATA